MILVVCLQRLVIYKLPPREVIVTAFLALGPLRQAGLCYNALGGVALTLTSKFRRLHDLSDSILYGIGVLIGWVVYSSALLWGFFSRCCIHLSLLAFSFSKGAGGDEATPIHCRRDM